MFLGISRLLVMDRSVHIHHRALATNWLSENQLQAYVSLGEAACPFLRQATATAERALALPAEEHLTGG